MRERASILRERGGIPWGLVGLLVLVVAVEGFVRRHPLDFADYMALSWRRGAEDAGRARADVLCFGDSLVQVGVQPRILEGRLGRSEYNLAIFGGQAPSSYFLLHRALRAGARPSAVVVDFHPNLLAVSPRSSSPYWADLLDLRDGLDLAWHARDPRLVVETALARLLPTSEGRRDIRHNLRSALLGVPPPDRDDRRAFLRNMRVNGGALVAGPTNRFPGGMGVGHDDDRRARRWSPNRVNAAYVRRFLDLAAEHGIVVYWLLPPTSPAWQARRDRLGLDDLHTRFVLATRAGRPNVVVVDGRRSGYGESLFHDATHLNRPGATELSAALAAVLAPGPGVPRPSPRWARLPAPLGRPEAVPLEDVEQSRLALDHLEATRR